MVPRGVLPGSHSTMRARVSTAAAVLAAVALLMCAPRLACGDHPASTMDVASARRVLRIRGVASAEEVRAAFHRASLRAHPDKGGSEDEFIEVSRAYEVLKGGSSGDVRAGWGDTRGGPWAPPRGASSTAPPGSYYPSHGDPSRFPRAERDARDRAFDEHRRARRAWTGPADPDDPRRAPAAATRHPREGRKWWDNRRPGSASSSAPASSDAKPRYPPPRSERDRDRDYRANDVHDRDDPDATERRRWDAEAARERERARHARARPAAARDDDFYDSPGSVDDDGARRRGAETGGSESKWWERRDGRAGELNRHSSSVRSGGGFGRGRARALGGEPVLGFDDDEETMEEYVRRRAYADSFGVGGHDRILTGTGDGDGDGDGGGGGVVPGDGERGRVGGGDGDGDAAARRNLCDAGVWDYCAAG